MRINRQRGSIRWRLVLIYLSIVCAALALINVLVTLVVEEFLLSERVNRQLEAADALAVELAPYVDATDAQSMYQLLAERGADGGARFLVLSPTGVVQVDAFSQLNGVKLTHNEVVQVLTGEKSRMYGLHRLNESTQGIRLFGMDDYWVLYCTSAITYNARQVGILMLSVPIDDVVNALGRIKAQVLTSSGFVALAVFVASFWTAGYLTKPIVELTRSIYQMSKGNFDQQVQIDRSGTGEILQLANTFNMMAKRLQILDNTRNEFVSNASHELKTPLSSIKVLVESMLQGPMDPQVQQEFLRDINNEIDRINTMISDLLALAQIDNKTSQKMRREPVALGEVIRRVAHSMAPIAQGKDLKIEAELEQDVQVLGDEGKLYQVVLNLMDNAAKYTPAGGRIYVTLRTRGSHAILQVQDNGIGIPEQDQAHVFERFYRVDKARSRATGGTGLGLSIVRQIVLQHRGAISVLSHEGEGSTFTVRLPLYAREMSKHGEGKP